MSATHRLSVCYYSPALFPLPNSPSPTPGSSFPVVLVTMVDGVCAAMPFLGLDDIALEGDTGSMSSGIECVSISATISAASYTAALCTVSVTDGFVE
ncbi:hypothetical protein KIPB_010851 [Kipferlia bialata]|uniref:Uncharacterized protein n=1 Tax=Kipferlia bialata TaxID=797122 RepID=A0A9K3GN84_9EUKA|nr:hypothetical protein KIPB_010851 [Kipferlia bialata]|eukprot:g10851.t1